MKEDEDKKRSQLKNWAIFTGIAVEMGGTIFACAWIGKQLDERYPSNKNWFTIGFVLFGLLGSIILVLQQLKRMDK